MFNRNLKYLTKLLIVLVISLTVLVAGCGPKNEQPSSQSDVSKNGEQKKDFSNKTLVVGTWGGVYEETLKEYVVKPLEQETGCKVELIIGGTGERRARIYAEKGNPTIDVAFLNIYESKQAIEDGVAEDVDPTIPNFSDLYPVAQQGGYGMSLIGVGIAYSKDHVTEPPKEWKDLWRPEYKGKIAFQPYPSFEDDSFISVSAKIWGKDEYDTDAAFEKIAELKPVGMVIPSWDECFNEMKNGNILAAPIISSYAYKFKAKGLPIDFAWPTDPGAVLGKDTIVITKGTKNPELAKLFVSKCLSPEVQQAFAEKLFFGPTNKKVKLSEEVATTVVYGEEKVKTLTTLDWDFILTQLATRTERWNREILSN